MDESDNKKTAKITVKVKAIDSEFVVLEDCDTKKKFYWPIKNISEPIEVGNSLYLELVTNSEIEIDIESSRKKHTQEHDQEEHKRKLLEELVN